MRSREEINEYVTESNAENNGQDTVALLQLEVMLDIRELLLGIEDKLAGMDETLDNIERRLSAG